MTNAGYGYDVAGNPTPYKSSALTFDLANQPTLYASVLFGGLLMRLPFRVAMTRVAALLMAALGLAFLWRGWTSL